MTRLKIIDGIKYTLLLLALVAIACSPSLITGPM